MQLKTSATARGGFTLLELLIVIVIMLMIISLTLGATFKALAFIRRGNTERTMQKVHTLIGKRQALIVTQANAVEPNGALLTLAGGDRRRARVLLQKLITKWAFPTSFLEVQDNYQQSLLLFDQSLGHPDAKFYLDKVGGLAANGGLSSDLETSNTACLALIYERLGGTGDLNGSELSTVQIGGRQFNVILDSWSVPMRYYRSPVNHINSAGVNYVERASPPEKWNHDADDPEGLLDLRRAENYDTNAATLDWYNINDMLYGFGLLGPWVHNNVQPFRSPQPPVPGWTPLYCPMTIVSAGPDGLFGLTPNDRWMSLVDSDNLGQAADNFYSYRARIAVTGQ